MENKIRLVKSKKELNEVREIRRIVFSKEQGIPESIEFDGKDSKAVHAAVFRGKRIIGCARIRMIGKKVKLERIAVLKNFRGKGIGKQITGHLIDYCKKRKIKKIFMYSQYYLKKFYEKLGFKAKGKPFKKAGIKHIEMEMKLA